MALQKSLKNFNLYLEGRGFAGIVAEATEPKLAIKTEEWRGGGMLGPVMIDLGLEAQEVEFTFGGLVLQTLRSFGVTTVDGVGIRLAGAYQDDATGQTTRREINVRGRFTELDYGNMQAGEKTEHKAKMAVAYYRSTVNGRTEIEVDMIAGIFAVDGVDRYADIMAAIS